MNARAITLLALAGVSSAHAQTYEKNDAPCIAELCIGDGLPELGKINWDRAKDPMSFGSATAYVGARPLDRFEMKRVVDVYRGDVQPAAPYLAYTAFDNKAFPLFAKVTAACGRRELTGTFKTESGLPTKVKIALLPGEKNSGLQRWTVVAIVRTYPTAVSTSQTRDLREQLEQRYARFNTYRGVPRGVEGYFSINRTASPTDPFGFGLSINPSRELKDFTQHPACGGNKKVPLD